MEENQSGLRAPAPCPFCCSTLGTVTVQWDQDDRRFTFWSCGGCGATGPAVEGVGCRAAEAILRWEHRNLRRIFVSAHGNDSANGLSPTCAVATIARGLQLAHAMAEAQPH